MKVSNDPKRILLLEDEAPLRRGIKLNLQAEGYHVIEFEEASSLIEYANQKKNRELLKNIVGIFDVMLPGSVDGFEACRQLRKNEYHFPIIFLTARNTLNDKLEGFKSGGDDYLSKPFDLEELLVRISAIFRRVSDTSSLEVSDKNFVVIGEWQLDVAGESARHHDGRIVRFNQREMGILLLLIEHRGKPVSRDEILDRAWSSAEFPTNRTIDNYIVKFRKIFENDPANPIYFITRHGLGYELATEEESQ